MIDSTTDQPKDRTPSEQLQSLFYRHLGNDWRRPLELKIRPSELYWFVRLMEAGIEAKREEARQANKDQPQDAMAWVASISSWTIDLEGLIEQVKSVLATTTPAPEQTKARKKKPRKESK